MESRCPLAWNLTVLSSIVVNVQRHRAILVNVPLRWRLARMKSLGYATRVQRGSPARGFIQSRTQSKVHSGCEEQYDINIVVEGKVIKK